MMRIRPKGFTYRKRTVELASAMGSTRKDLDGSIFFLHTCKFSSVRIGLFLNIFI
jgi:hypothetical protein